jgi:hypothetical protein
MGTGFSISFYVLYPDYNLDPGPPSTPEGPLVTQSGINDLLSSGGGGGGGGTGATLFGQAPFSRNHGDQTPDYVKGWQQELSPRNVARLAVESAGVYVEALGEAAVETALDATPILGTYRLFERGEYFWGSVSVLTDVVLVFKAVKLFTTTKAAVGSGRSSVTQWEREAADHRKNRRESNREKHEDGQTRKKRDYGNEKGDDRRRPPRQRPPGHKGPWPPRPSASDYQSPDL